MSGGIRCHRNRRTGLDGVSSVSVWTEGAMAQGTMARGEDALVQRQGEVHLARLSQGAFSTIPLDNPIISY